MNISCTVYKMYTDTSALNTVIDFIGKGYGHHLGICQWGARYMVDAGWNYQRILQFYYPGADFMKLKKGNLCPNIKVI